MADRITINFTANTREVERGADRISDSLGDVEDALDDVGTEGERSLEKATGATDDLSESAGEAGGKIGSIGGIAKDALEGDLSGAAAAGADALSALGPAGAAAGLIAVTGISVIQGVIEGIGEATKADEARVSEWAQAYIEAGGKILNSTQILAGALDITTDPDKYKEAKTNAELWGTSLGVAVLAMAGNQDALAEATAKVDAAGQSAIRTAQEAAEADRDLTTEQIAFNSAQAAGRSKLLELTATMQLGAEQADVYSEALRLTAQSTKGATATVDEFGDSVYNLPDGTVIYIDAETGQATQDTDAIANKIYGLTDKTVAISVDTANAKTQLDALFANPFTAKVRFPNSPTYGVGVKVP